MIPKALNCRMWGFSAPYAYSVSLLSPHESESYLRCFCVSVQHFKRWPLSSWARACSNCNLYGSNRKRLGIICHGVSCGITSTRLVLLVILRGCVEKPPSHAPPSSPKGLVILGNFRCTGTRHGGIIHTTALPTGESLPYLGREPRCTVTVDCIQAHKKPSLLQSPPCCFNLLP
jgi:hypothetical protein